MLTNLGCTFTSSGTALITYLHVNDAGVKSGQFVPLSRGGSGTSEFVGLKTAIVDTALLLR